MAGNARSGRRPSQIDARTRLDPNDVPERPGDLAGLAAEYWNSSIAPAAHLTRADTDIAVECCRQYAIYRQAVIGCERIPLDDEAAKTCGRHFDRWTKLATLLCLDTVGRIRSMKATRRDSEGEQIDKEAAMFGVVG